MLRGSDSAALAASPRLAPVCHVAFPLTMRGRHAGYGDFGAQWLACVCPVNASPASSRPPTHDSGWGRLARYFPYDSFIRNSSSV
jgi:hypothetical protein